MAELRTHLLGEFSVRTETGTVSLRSRRTEALLAYLLLTGEPHSREHLGDLLWDTGNPTRAAGNLRVLLTNLRRGLGECVEITRTSVQFCPPQDWTVVTDLEQFRATAAGPLRVPVSALGDDHLEALDAASTLARGGLLERLEVPGCPRFDDWLSAERAGVDRERLAVQTHLVEGLLTHARHEPAIAAATRWKALDPLSEAPRAALIRARIAAGEVAGARHEYELLESMLHAELGETPSRETRAVLERAERRLAGPPRPRARHRPAARTRRTEQLERAPWSRFVGRQTELATIVQGYAEVLQGRGAVVVVQGGTGSGKSMLLRQASQLLVRQDRSVAVLGASCGSFPAGSGPASSLYVAHVLGQLEGDASGPWLGASMPLPVAARVAELDALGSSAANDHVTPAARLVGSIRHLSTTRPVVLVADDLQWADDVTLQALADLAQDLRSRPVLLLLASRPDPVAVQSQRLLARISRGRSDVRIDLDHDSADEARPFVEALLASEPHDLPETFVRQLGDLSGGHPQTTVELLRDMARRRVLDKSPEGRYQLVAPADVRVPERVGKLLDEQLHDLPEGHAGVVEAAAVCGPQFDVRVVAALCDRPLEDVIRVVAGRPGMTSPLFAPVWEGHDGSSTHRFRHPLMHQHVRTGMDRVWLEHLGQARLGLDSTRESTRWIRRRTVNGGPHATD